MSLRYWFYGFTPGLLKKKESSMWLSIMALRAWAATRIRGTQGLAGPCVVMRALASGSSQHSWLLMWINPVAVW